MIDAVMVSLVGDFVCPICVKTTLAHHPVTPSIIRCGYCGLPLEVTREAATLSDSRSRNLKGTSGRSDEYDKMSAW